MKKSQLLRLAPIQRNPKHGVQRTLISSIPKYQVEGVDTIPCMMANDLEFGLAPVISCTERFPYGDRRSPLGYVHTAVFPR